MRKAAGIFVLALLLAMVAAGSGAPASQGVLRVKPETVKFGVKPVGSSTFKGATIKNVSSGTVNLLVTITLSPDDFGFVIPPTTCPVFGPAPLASGESCEAVMRFSPSEFFAGREQLAQLQAQATTPATGAVLDTVLINFTGRGK